MVERMSVQCGGFLRTLSLRDCQSVEDPALRFVEGGTGEGVEDGVGEGCTGERVEGEVGEGCTEEGVEDGVGEGCTREGVVGRREG